MFPWSQECLDVTEEIVVYNVEENNTKGFFDDYNVTYNEVFNASKIITKTFFKFFKKAEKTCNYGTKGFKDIASADYAMNQTVLKMLIAVVVVGGILAVFSNMVVLFFGLKKKVFPAPILTLAFNDLLTGLLGTPFVMAIYYFSEYMTSSYFLIPHFVLRAHSHTRCKWSVQKQVEGLFDNDRRMYKLVLF